jgi:hypothetical protein
MPESLKFIVNDDKSRKILTTLGLEAFIENPKSRKNKSFVNKSQDLSGKRFLKDLTNIQADPAPLITISRPAFFSDIPNELSVHCTVTNMEGFEKLMKELKQKGKEFKTILHRRKQSRIEKNNSEML